MVLSFYDYFMNKIQTFPGAYVPLTNEGSIIVDGVLASCYPSTHHDLGHIGMTPMRWFPEMMQCVFGEVYGFSLYVGITESVGKWMFSDK